MVKCKKCGNEFEGRFCNSCGEEDASVTCLACGNIFYGNFCNKCGKEVSPPISSINHNLEFSTRNNIQGSLKTISTTTHSVILKKMFSLDLKRWIY